MKAEEAYKLMDKETWFTADEALEIGLIDEILYSDEKVDKQLLNSLKNSAITFCNNIGSINDIALQKLKNYTPIQPKENFKADFFVQEKMKAKLKLMKLKGEIK